MKTLLTLAAAFACAFHLAGAAVRLPASPMAPPPSMTVQAD